LLDPHLVDAGVVDHRITAVQRAANGVAVREGAADQLDAGLVELAGLLGAAHERAHVVAALAEGPRDAAADEPRGTGEEDAHLAADPISIRAARDPPGARFRATDRRPARCRRPRRSCRRDASSRSSRRSPLPPPPRWPGIRASRRRAGARRRTGGRGTTPARPAGPLPAPASR